MKSIRFWLALAFISLVLLVTISISYFFYKEFRQSLDERVLLQLTSIRNLKGIQVKEYIEDEWTHFLDRVSDLDNLKENNPEELKLGSHCIKNIIQNKGQKGISDVTDCHPEKETVLLFHYIVNDDTVTHILDGEKIQKVLQERTGMGQSGETYIVGKDKKLRTQSRFFPEKTPFLIDVKASDPLVTKEERSGTRILKDYRNVDVYSSYSPLDIGNLHWFILSEIDVEEVTIPLEAMKQHLSLILVGVIIVAALLSVLISRLLSRPILFVRTQLNKMSSGDYNPGQNPSSFLLEVSEMLEALEGLKKSITGAIRFSQNLGEMNLASKYEPAGEKDILGKSLLRMQDQLLQFKSKESESRKEAQKLFIKGQEKERERLSKELHDGIGPMLTGLKFLFQTEKEETLVKEKAVELIDQTIDDVRRMTYALMPPAIRDFGVGKALIHFTSLIAKSTKIDIQYYDGTKEKNSQIDDDLGICLFRIVQELVNNSIKHAEAEIIRITLTEFDEYCTLDYFDNGKGFDINVIQKGAGLRNIAERIDVFNGKLDLYSEGEGTRIEIEIPLNV